MKQLEEKYNIGWRDFEIDSIFKKIQTKKLPYKAQDLKGVPDEIYCLPALSAGIQNQGLAYYVPRENATILKNVISVSANGANTGAMFYQPNEFTVLQDSYAIQYKYGKLNSSQYLYLVSALKKSIRVRYDWSNKAGWERIKTEYVKLPVTSDGDIAFEYMVEFIKKIEQDRLCQLQQEKQVVIETYLTVTNLEDFQITTADKKLLSTFDGLQKSTIGKGTYNKLIELPSVLNWCDGIKELDPLELNLLVDDKEEEYPFYGQSTVNNGIIEYRQLTKSVLNNIDGNPTILIHSNNQNSVYLETPFYLKDGHGATSVLQSKELNRYNAFYIMTATKKVISQRFNYNAKATKIGLKGTSIMLPQRNNSIDYEFMTNFIKVIEKLVISDLVNQYDEKIRLTKEIVLDDKLEE